MATVASGVGSQSACSRNSRATSSGREQAERGLFPLVLWIVPDDRRANKFDAALQAAHNLDRALFRITTAEKLLDVIEGGSA